MQSEKQNNRTTKRKCVHRWDKGEQVGEDGFKSVEASMRNFTEPICDGKKDVDDAAWSQHAICDFEVIIRVRKK